VAAESGDYHLVAVRSLIPIGLVFYWLRRQLKNGSELWISHPSSREPDGRKFRFSATLVGHGVPAAHRVPARVRENPLDDPRRAGFSLEARALPHRE
jgi:hypothetical protein